MIKKACQKKINEELCEKKNKTSVRGVKSYIKFTIKRVWQWIKNLFLKIHPLYRRGTHIITGYVGSGKTLLVNRLINTIDSEKYFFISNLDEFKQENVYHYDIWELFENGTQVAKLPTKDAKGRKLYALILDEINLKFNRRMNRTTSYNNQFVGLVEFLVSSRHQGVNRVYFIGQKLELQDTQLQSLFKYCHNILLNKTKAYYELYLESGAIIYAPKRIYFENYIKNFDDEFESENIKQAKITYDDLKSYDTYGLRNIYEQLPFANSNDKKLFIKSDNN